MIRKILGLGLILCVFSVPAWSLLEKKHWEIMATPGLSLPGGNSNELENQCPTFAGSVEYQWSKKFSAGIEFAKDQGHVYDGTLFKDVDLDGKIDALKASGNVEAKVTRIGPILKWGSVSDWGTWGQRWVRNFFIFGAGLYHYDVNAGELDLFGTSTNGTVYNGEKYPVAKESSDHFGLSVGVGLQIEIFKRGLIGFEVRYHRFFRSAPDAEYWTPSLKFGIMF